MLKIVMKAMVRKEHLQFDIVPCYPSFQPIYPDKREHSQFDIVPCYPSFQPIYPDKRELSCFDKSEI